VCVCVFSRVVSVLVLVSVCSAQCQTEVYEYDIPGIVQVSGMVVDD